MAQRGDAGGPHTAGQVARSLGVAETTLRSWHRRYGVPPHADRPGGYRRYTREDIVRLERMRDLIRSGVLASDAARIAAVQPAEPGLGAARDRLLEASRSLDSRTCQAVLTEAVGTYGIVPVWDTVCRPALVEVEHEQRADPAPATCVPREHVLSWAIAAALHHVPPAVPEEARPTVLLACVEDEQHTLPLEALAAALTERHVPVRMLGAGLPTAGLVAAARTLSPAAVVLWAHRPDTAQVDALRRLRRLPPRVLTAGPGWSARRRASAGYLPTLDAALAELA
ncbi:MerR family transcriptional regulator [Actinophytocola gossypii]|uniref:MerR family transcriptional regulator n=1 Tax=Actinophytocola gossypii TaxID=2812003 RepID=A0ABT2JJS0_9PSEU|nr:MerR family transcriptional regulator [Actinophytocola gossypii]MCT2587764.1 MerR family transcriptional regulator [Actinophytocola gossypii]